MAVEKPVLLSVETHVVPKPLERFQGDVFESFVSEGSMSPVVVTESEKPVIELRDMGAAQTVILKNVLSLSVDTDLHKSVLVECYWRYRVSIIAITQSVSEVEICDW